ncbi:hypothetical protein Z948_3320 [Sulfitobacter donghicola DSW-25 = KCTC 12864 = JCM 14565]|nr:hypothetical protein Z948_3320 [Sulfitobacter donghicola DSW-25 = KCTC 12864 = JCM 14565]
MTLRTFFGVNNLSVFYRLALLSGGQATCAEENSAKAGQQDWMNVHWLWFS